MCRNLVDAILLDGCVEGGVQVVEQVHHLHGRGARRQRREAHDVAEVDGHLLELLGRHARAQQQALRHGPGTPHRASPAAPALEAGESILSYVRMYQNNYNISYCLKPFCFARVYV